MALKRMVVASVVLSTCILLLIVDLFTTACLHVEYLRDNCLTIAGILTTALFGIWGIVWTVLTHWATNTVSSDDYIYG